MAAIIHRLGIKASVAKVHSALASIEGLGNWWTRETSGSATLGGQIEFLFRNDDGSIKGGFLMEVKRLDPEKVEWACVKGPADWVGTGISFSLKREGEQTILLFSHHNWQEATESTAHCSMKWATFLLSLRDYVQTGRGKPAPDDIKIDNWN